MSSILTSTVASDSIKVASAALAAAASEATTTSTGTTLFGKVETIVGTAEHGVETFFQHNPTLAPVANALVGFAEDFAQSHGVPVTLLSIFSSGLAGILSQAPASTVTVAKAGS
jgi:hypothetical protein